MIEILKAAQIALLETPNTKLNPIQGLEKYKTHQHLAESIQDVIQNMTDHQFIDYLKG